ncbi:uncharacterized protein LOC115417778 [Sphaeramia orbicularis]|uniref:uncharacterized protein LOC115417778 n=1 Tax=Sphaeramia orbicularis TaxID=375764 RepID=UPI00117ED06E|nr:uncharacterized protein LOC115417778 [Sphaeramia orbicularis]
MPLVLCRHLSVCCHIAAGGLEVREHLLRDSIHGTGKAMPQTGTNLVCRKGGLRRGTCKDFSLSDQVLDTDSVDGTVSERTPSGTHNGTKPPRMVNGYIKHGFSGKTTKALPAWTHKKHENRISSVPDKSAAAGVSGAGLGSRASVNGAARPDSGLCADQVSLEPGQTAAKKTQKRKKIYRHRKRDSEKTFPTLPLMPPQQEEDWENDIQDVTFTGMENMCFGISPYGPEDILNFDLRDLTLKQTDTVPPPVTANYSPTIHHPCPLKWSQYRCPSEPDQFADAEE